MTFTEYEIQTIEFIADSHLHALPILIEALEKIIEIEKQLGHNQKYIMLQAHRERLLSRETTDLIDCIFKVSEKMRKCND